MHEALFGNLHQKSKTVSGLKVALEKIWDNFVAGPISEAVPSFTNSLIRVCEW